jgi:hypothetical protein
MVLTEAQLQEIAKRVRAIIRAESKGVGDLPVATSLDGLLSLPALRFNGGVPEVVEALISKLQDVALDAVSGATKAANEAAAKANTSAGNADKATTAANNAAKSANDAAGTAGAATEAAKKATESANGAASNATNAATKASSAADTANKEASSVNAAKSEALAAAARASSTATTAEAEIEKMKQLQESISGAASLAPTRMELTYTKRITQRNPYVQRIVAKMFPSYSLQNVLFLGDDVAVSVDPAGVVTPLKIGTSRIHVIPTQATHLYKTINVTVQAPSVRLTGGGKIRIDSKGRIRLT